MPGREYTLVARRDVRASRLCFKHRVALPIGEAEKRGTVKNNFVPGQPHGQPQAQAKSEKSKENIGA